MIRTARQKIYLAAAFAGMAGIMAVGQVQAEARFDGLGSTRLQTNFFDFQAGVQPRDPLQERGIETDFSVPEGPGSQPKTRNFYERPRNVFESGGKDR